jgi:hypothetical protein
MNKDDGVYVDGQGVQVPSAPVSLVGANDEMQKIGVSDTSGFASTKIKNMLSDPGFRSGDAFVTEEEINKRANVAWSPMLARQGGTYEEDFTSSTGQIIKDEVVKFGMNLQTLGDKAQIGLGGLASLATGGAIGNEMRDRAYDSLESATRRMNLENTHAADAETLTAQVTQGAASMLEMIATGLMTGGTAPLAQMGVEAFGDGTYNNMIKYANEHGGSIDGYEGNWLETGIDLANAAVQVGIERYLGVGKNYLKGTGGHFLKEMVEGFAQESSQDFLTDLSEYLKGNQGAPTNWEQYLVSGVIGGLLQGSLGAATYKYARTQADNEMSDLIFKATKARHPEKDDAELYKESRAQAKSFNDDIEMGVVQNTWDELANRIDANNDRGKIRDNLVTEFTKARVAALGLKSAEELDADDLADIQDAATVAAGEAFRESFIEGVPIEQTLTARLTADGKDLIVRDLKPEERGVAEKSRIDLDTEAGRLAEQMAAGRERAEQRRRATEEKIRQARLDADLAARADNLAELESWAAEQVRLGETIGAKREKAQTTFSKKEIDRWLKQSSSSEQSRKREDAKTKQVSQRMLELGKKKRTDGYTVKQIESNIRSAKDSELQDFVRRVYGYNTRRFARGVLVDLALKQKNQWTYIKREKRDSLKIGEQLGRMRQETIEREMDQQDQWLANYSGVPLSVISNMTDAEYKEFSEKMIARYAAEEEAKEPQYTEEDLATFDDIPFQQKLDAIARGVIEDSGRGAYDMRYQRIILNKDSDVSTILHELSHMWLNNWFKAYRSENAPESFRKWWRPVERALGIRESDRFLDQDASEKFARSFEKWVLDGGKGAESSLTPVFERLSKRLADIYDDLATRYFDMVGDLKPEVQSWFAKNEVLADSMVVDVPERNEETGEETVEKVSVQYRDRAAERENAQKMAREEEVAQRVVDREADEINNIVENTASTPLAADSDEVAQSPYTADGRKEQRTSKRIVESAKAEGVLLESRKYDPLMSKRAAEDAVVFATADLDSAFEVAMGRKNAPGDVPRIAVFFAVQNKLMLNPVENAARLQELALNSPVIEELSRAGQQLRMAGVALSKDSPMRILRDLSKMYDENLTDAERASITENINKINDYIARADLNTEDVWNKILSDMECK